MTKLISKFRFSVSNSAPVLIGYEIKRLNSEFELMKLGL